MKVEAAFFSRQGQKEKNDDSVMPLFYTSGGWWAAVADGMGGHPGGALASSTAINSIKNEIERHDQIGISDLFSAARESLRRVATERPELSAMGTTLSLIHLTPNGGETGHVGDSRVYQLRSEGLMDRTVDQTEVEELVQRGVLSKASARRYPRRNVLLSVLSPSRDYQLHKEAFEIELGDRFVLLTDGVTSKLLRKEIRDLSLNTKTVQSFCDAIREETDKRLPSDDYSAVCIEVSEL
jgi:protein phosphatase